MAKERREVHKARVQAVDLRGDANDRQRTEQRGEHVRKNGVANDVCRQLRIQQQILRHVQHKECPHAVKAETLPHFSKK